MSQDTVEVAQPDVSRLDELVMKFGICRVAQVANDKLPRIILPSKAARIDLHRGIRRIQTGCYDPNVCVKTFDEMVQLGNSVITPTSTKKLMRKLMKAAVGWICGTETDELEQPVAMSSVR